MKELEEVYYFRKSDIEIYRLSSELSMNVEDVTKSKKVSNAMVYALEGEETFRTIRFEGTRLEFKPPKEDEAEDMNSWILAVELAVAPLVKEHKNTLYVYLNWSKIEPVLLDFINRIIKAMSIPLDGKKS